MGYFFKAGGPGGGADGAEHGAAGGDGERRSRRRSQHARYNAYAIILRLPRLASKNKHTGLFNHWH